MEMLRLFNLIPQTPRLEQPAAVGGEGLPRAGEETYGRIVPLTHTLVVGMKSTIPGPLDTQATCWHTVKEVRNWHLMKSNCVY